MDELRNEIFDYLYRAEGAKSIAEIAEYVHQEGEMIRTAVDCDWFSVVGDQVTIAYGDS